MRRALLNGNALAHATCVCEVGFCADSSGACRKQHPAPRHSRLSLLAPKPPGPAIAGHDVNMDQDGKAAATYTDASEIKATLRKHIAWCIVVAFTLFLVVAFLFMWCLGHRPHVVYERVVYYLQITRRKTRRLTTAEQATADRPTATLQPTSEPATEIRVVRDAETKKFHAQLLVGEEYFRGPGRDDYRDADGDLQKFLRSYHMAPEGKEREQLRKAVVQLKQGGC